MAECKTKLTEVILPGDELPSREELVFTILALTQNFLPKEGIMIVDLGQLESLCVHINHDKSRNCLIFKWRPAEDLATRGNC